MSTTTDGSTPSSTANLLDILKSYAEIRRRLDALEGLTDDDETLSRPLPAATPGAIAALEAELETSLPPSYRAFLEQHNGWAGFWGAMWIAGADGDSQTYVREQLEEAAEYTDLEVPAPGWIGGVEGERYIVLGADDNGGFLAFSNDRDAGGERRVLDIPRGLVENEWATFDAFVRAQHRYRERDLERASEG